jgi:hypothetical protein
MKYRMDGSWWIVNWKEFVRKQPFQHLDEKGEKDYEKLWSG